MYEARIAGEIFGIALPVVLFGVIKVRDELNVRFNLTLPVAS